MHPSFFENYFCFLGKSDGTMAPPLPPPLPLHKDSQGLDPPPGMAQQAMLVND